MAWIATVSEHEAHGRLKEIYDSFAGKFPVVPNIMKAFSLKPEVLGSAAGLVTNVTFGASSLSRAQEEMIATAVSSLNRCHY
jgi:alkylhydroperoxidase family enzyme